MKKYYSMYVIEKNNNFYIAYILNNDSEVMVHYKPFHFTTFEAASRYVYYTKDI